MEKPWMSFRETSKAKIMKEPRRYACGYLEGPGDSLSFLGDFSWPPRLYTCSFCKREFRSAQALGGHMNIHRRDRARLRESPPRNPNHERITNLNYPPDLFSMDGGAETAPSSVLCPLTAPLASYHVGGKVVKVEEGDGGRLRSSTVLRLELEIGICGGDVAVEEQLDLELRLGYA